MTWQDSIYFLSIVFVSIPHFPRILNRGLFNRKVISVSRWYFPILWNLRKNLFVKRGMCKGRKFIICLASKNNNNDNDDDEMGWLHKAKLVETPTRLQLTSFYFLPRNKHFTVLYKTLFVYFPFLVKSSGYTKNQHLIIIIIIIILS